MTAALRCTGLTAGYEGVTVVRDLDLHVDAGEVVSLLGPNGAGKTTTLLALSGLLPASGAIELAGEAVAPSRRAARRVRGFVRRGVAHVTEERSLFPGLTVAEHLRLVSRDRPTVERALEPFPALGDLLHRRAGLLSGGEQQMLALARALAAQPRVLLIDEMSLGLAPIVVEHLLPVVREIARRDDVAVLLVEQQVPAALAVSDRAYVLRRGRVVAAGPAVELAADRGLLTSSYLGG